MTKKIQTTMKTIEDVILKHSTRGMDKLQNIHPKNFCKIAVEEFLKLEKGTVFLYTGFYVSGFAETDGPVGTYLLSVALKKLGYSPIIITDNYCKDYFKEIETLYLTHEDCNNKNFDILIKKYAPIAHISIERIGRSKDDNYMNSKKQSIAKYTIPLDLLFEYGGIDVPTFAIGDGGNEIGMGNFHDYLEKNIDVIPSIVCCDYLIIATVSNWGAYGFISYLQQLTKQNIMPTFDDIDKYMDHIVDLGAVDGISRKNEKTIDGKEWQIEKDI